MSRKHKLSKREEIELAIEEKPIINGRNHPLKNINCEIREINCQTKARQELGHGGNFVRVCGNRKCKEGGKKRLRSFIHIKHNSGPKS